MTPAAARKYLKERGVTLKLPHGCSKKLADYYAVVVAKRLKKESNDHT